MTSEASRGAGSVRRGSAQAGPASGARSVRPAPVRPWPGREAGGRRPPSARPAFLCSHQSCPLASASSSPPRRWQSIHNGRVFIRVIVPLSAEKSNAILLMKVMCRDGGGWELLGLVWPRLKTFRENTNSRGHTQKVPLTSVRPICFALEK